MQTQMSLETREAPGLIANYLTSMQAERLAVIQAIRAQPIRMAVSFGSAWQSALHEAAPTMPPPSPTTYLRRVTASGASPAHPHNSKRALSVSTSKTHWRLRFLNRVKAPTCSTASTYRAAKGRSHSPS